MYMYYNDYKQEKYVHRDRLHLYYIYIYTDIECSKK